MPGTVFYDGACGFCQGWTRWLAQADTAGHWRFAPINGRTWTTAGLVAEADSVTVLTGDGRMLVRWQAVRHLAISLGGWCRIGGWLMFLVPRVIGDRLYDVVARHRHRLAKPPDGPCPLLPPALRARFEAE